MSNPSPATPEAGAANPTASIDLDFAHYVAARQSEKSSRFVNDVPDYSFALDAVMRQRLSTLGPIRNIAQLLVSASAPLQRQLHQMHGLMVGPRHFPKIYAMGEECARRLGIGIPQIFITPAGEANAFTLTTDDVRPVLVLTRELVELLDDEELRFVIGHECGHIHNLHGVYNNTVVLLVNPAARMALQKLLAFGAPLGILRMIASALQGGLQLFLLHWSRCAEITCDRAGLICCGELRLAERALVKMITGGGKLFEQFNIEAHIEQMRDNRSPLWIWDELKQTHPLIAKRIEAVRLFADTDTFFEWRPDLAHGRVAQYTKAEADRRCEQLVDIR